MKIVCDLMSELVISDTADNRVETCSGGEQKRIVIACELTSHIKPNMLCIDEPTSGLDSNAAEVPNNDLLHMFDNIYVLAKGGVCLYSGVAHHLRQHLKDNGIECNEKQVPIEVLLKLSSKEISNKNDNNIEEKSGIYNNGVNCDQILVSNMRPVFGSLSISKRFSFVDLYYLLSRSLTHTFRCQWVSLLLQFICFQMLGIVMLYGFSADIILPDGCVELEFGAECYQTEAEIRDEILIKQNIKYNCCLLLAVPFVVLIVMSVTFGSNFRVFRSQQQNGWYSTGTYLWCRTIVDLIPIFIALPVFLWITNRYNTITFYVFTFAVILLVIICTQSAAQLASLLFMNDTKVALIVAILIHATIFFMSNSLIPVKELHYIMQELSHLSYIRHAYECIIIMLYGFDRCQGKVSLIYTTTVMASEMAIAWTDLRVSVGSGVLGGKEKRILCGICGAFTSGSLNALMGSSGSGKSTLLKCLNANNEYVLSDGSAVYVKSGQQMSKCFIYQDQNERIMTGLTVVQALTYSSKLKNSNNCSVEMIDHKNNVSVLMEELLISDIADNVIEKCSSGQIKRICIALELTSVVKP
ncbi:unnamed protein product [Medioppia subpectinata]|uniref:ABC transporter domain-containing protein n=1 Tax=Medioppia subpectinata TaxID=1979941 RepID=A0A7R9KKQ2_9ACAR|nr:unnamed protein product [Medioppia subpectinata]CAG2105240.1 unnamed protein product [Medioppia subpectinata]